MSLTWLSEQTGVAVATILKHYGRFIHSSQADDIELSKIQRPVHLEHRVGHPPKNVRVPKIENVPDGISPAFCAGIPLVGTVKAVA